MTLILLTLVAPGSAQLVAGNRRVGQIALRIVGGMLAVAGLLALIGLISSRALVAILANPFLLRLIQLSLAAAAVGWFALFVDAWRLGRPLALRQKQRLTSTVLTLGLASLAVSVVLTSSHYAAVARYSLQDVFSGVQAVDPYAGRYNILLLGVDADADRVGLRPDSITLASVDAETGDTALLSFPRNLQRVPFPAGTVMHEQFPNGFFCDDGECLLNAIYTWATDHRELFPGVADPGLEATKSAIRGLTGLEINYYALVDMRGFAELVDALGGITVDVERDIPISGPDGEVRETIPAGVQRLDGYHALWYARSRSDSSDYDRMARQRCVMAAMLRQLDPSTVLLKFREIAEAGRHVLSTDIPVSELDTLADLATKVKRAKVTSVQFVPPLIDTSDPDLVLIRRKVRAAIEASKSVARARTAASPAAGASSHGGKAKSRSGPDVVYLSAACQAP